MTTVAATILAQLGGNKFIAMTGATNLSDGGNNLQMKLGKGTKNKATHLTITLDALTDTYRLEFIRFARGNIAKLPAVYGLHAEDLQRVFTEHTGFDTRL